MAQFRVVGAGFTGLVAAYELAKEGHEVEVFEKLPRVGGLISTQNSNFGLVETAANGVLNTFAFEQLCQELGVPLVATKSESKKRFIFRDGKARRWPLGFRASIKLLWGFSKLKPPVAFEAVAEWGNKNFNTEAVDYILAPALQGIYAGDAQKMSSSLIFSRFFLKKKRQRPQIKGSVSPENGMGQLMEALKTTLIEKGVKFHLREEIASLTTLHNTLIATSAVDAAELLKNILPNDSKILKNIDMLPLVRVTLFFKEPRQLKGFGVLFPQLEKFNSLGVLFDDSIFARPVANTTESWILGGAFDRSIHELSDAQILSKISIDRKRVLGVDQQPDHFVITRWPKALPHYTCQLEENLNQLSSEAKQHLIGNYLGRIGLSQMLEQTQNKVQEWNQSL